MTALGQVVNTSHAAKYLDAFRLAYDSAVLRGWRSGGSSFQSQEMVFAHDVATQVADSYDFSTYGWRP